MNKSKTIKLNAEEVVNISSDYIREGRLFESWKINEVIIHDKNAFMDVSMVNVYSSKPDKSDFHLSIFVAEEMASQLMIIYMHIFAGLKKKESEVWMLESQTKSIHSIRDQEHIDIKMDVTKIRKHGHTILAFANYSITDSKGGLIKLQFKVMLS